VRELRKQIQNKNYFFLVALLIWLALFPASLFGQYQGKIEGVVLDSAGNPLEKAEVIIVSQMSTSINYRLTTDKQGHFVQIGLRPGFYLVEVRKGGFGSKSFEVKVSIAEATKVEVRLEKAQEMAEKNLSEADRLFLQGNKFYSEQKYAEAVAAYQEALKLNPQQWAYYFNLGLSYKKMGQKEEALKAFRQAQSLNPESFSANKELGESLAKEGNFEEAHHYYEKAVLINPEDADAFYNLGICWLNLGELEKAVEAFEKVLQLNKDYAEAYYQLGTVFISLNRINEAIASLETFLKLAQAGDPRIETARQLLSYLKK
jgi:tetratricopeptide (TPR) repeat protein